jgi:hypothetical protein
MLRSIFRTPIVLAFALTVLAALPVRGDPAADYPNGRPT